MLVRHSLGRDPTTRPIPYRRYANTPTAAISKHQSCLTVLQAGHYSPLILRHPETAGRVARDVLSSYAGRVIYAMKPNRSSWLLQILWANGIRSFLVTSISEMRQLRDLFGQPQMNFMHPVKNQMAIQHACSMYSVRTFALDSEDELAKIIRATEAEDVSKERDLTLCVRIAVSSASACLPLAAKFGVAGKTAESLLRRTRKVAKRLGISFNLGSQCMDPADYEAAVQEAAQLSRNAGVMIDVLDVGGGVPVPYPGLDPPSRLEYSQRILRTVKDQEEFQNVEVWFEPGRDLSARAESLVIRVELVKDDCIHVNDGLYGRLHDPARYAWPVEMVLLRNSRAERRTFSMAGPTLDSQDLWMNACCLPGDVSIGDYIWVRDIGAYGKALSTDFDGFGNHIKELDVAESEVIATFTCA